MKHGLIEVALLALAVVASSIATAWLLRTTREERPNTQPTHNVEPSKPQRDPLTTVTVQNAEPPMPVGTRDPRQVLADTNPTEGRAPLTPEERLAVDQRRAEQIEVQFETDSEPVAESYKFQKDITGAFAPEASHGVRVEVAECRLRLCRVQLLFDNMGADSDIFDRLFRQARPGQIGAHAGFAPTRESLSDGRVRTTLYLAREGEIEFFE